VLNKLEQASKKVELQARSLVDKLRRIPATIRLCQA